MKKKIVIIGTFAFTDNQTKRLQALGDVKKVSNPSSSKDWLKEVRGADIILSDGTYLLENLYNLKSVFVTYPYIELGAFDSSKLQKNGVTIANTQGSNRNSIIEWVIFMILSL